MNSLQDLFLSTLKDVYFAEGAILKALPKMIKAVKSDDLKTAFEAHRKETLVHVERLDQVFKLMNEKPKAERCPVIEGLVEECEQIIADATDDDTRDAGVLACGQAVEHYEISRYGTLRAWAERLEMDDAVDLLQETLEEEKEADEKLSELAYAEINADADEADDDDAPEKAAPSAAKAGKQSKSMSARKST